MRPFLVTAPEARRLPYWALATLLAFYILPGFIGRDPWRSRARPNRRAVGTALDPSDRS
jgi:hypothetical protein